MDDLETMKRYNDAKAIVKKWEHEYRAIHGKRPDRAAMSAADQEIRAAYSTFYKLRSVFSSNIENRQNEHPIANTDICNSLNSNAVDFSSNSTKSSATIQNRLCNVRLNHESAPKSENITKENECNSAVNLMSVDRSNSFSEVKDNIPENVWSKSLNRSSTKVETKVERAPVCELYSKLADNMRANFFQSLSTMPRLSLKKNTQQFGNNEWTNNKLRPVSDGKEVVENGISVNKLSTGDECIRDEAKLVPTFTCSSSLESSSENNSFKIKMATPRTSSCSINYSGSGNKVASNRLAGNLNADWVERCIFTSLESSLDETDDFRNEGTDNCGLELTKSSTSVDSGYTSFGTLSDEYSQLTSIENKGNNSCKFDQTDDSASKIINEHDVSPYTASIENINDTSSSNADVSESKQQILRQTCAVDANEKSAVESESELQIVSSHKRKRIATLEELLENETITPSWPPSKRKRLSSIVKNSEEEIDQNRLRLKAKGLNLCVSKGPSNKKCKGVFQKLASHKLKNKTAGLPKPCTENRAELNCIPDVSCHSANRTLRSDLKLPANKEQKINDNKYENEIVDVSDSNNWASDCEVESKILKRNTRKSTRIPHKTKEMEKAALTPENTRVPDYDEQLYMEGNFETNGKKWKQYDAKDRLLNKISNGTINENYIKIDLKKKVFVRGKKGMTGAKYRRMEWKRKQGLKKFGRNTFDEEGKSRKSKILTCFKCGDIGHWASRCPRVGKLEDALLPDKDRPPVTFLTLEEAANLARGIKTQDTGKFTRLFIDRNDVDCDSSSANVCSTQSTPEISSQCNLEEMKGALEGKDVDNLRAAPDRNLSCNNKNMSPDDDSEWLDDSETEYNFNEMESDIQVDNTLPNSLETNATFLKSGRKPVDPILGSDATEGHKMILDTLQMFGHSSFRPGQEEAIIRILQGKNTLLVLSTGSGKSLCYQLPAYIYAQKQRCITLCVSPLVSLMEDQVTGLPAFLRAVCLHTNQTPQQRENSLKAVREGRTHILLVSPEAVIASGAGGMLGTLMKDLPAIGFACVDEAHCVSQWSHNFRPSYLRVCKVLREQLGVRTILGLTATARYETTVSIAQHLQVSDARAGGIITGSSVPVNLQLSVSRDQNKPEALVQLLQGGRFANCSSIIVYCTRRDECERVATLLRSQLLTPRNIDVKANLKRSKAVSLDAEAYHAGLSAYRRRQIQNRFMSGKLRIVVATVAFGMGIDKSDVRGIIHYNMPMNLESYVQEIGRAGRDGEESHCHLFLDSLDGRDLQELKRFIFVNSVDRVTIRKLLTYVFVPCSCMKAELCRPVSCPGHEVALSISELVEHLDIPEENILTLLCYLELKSEKMLELLPNAYGTCTVSCYGGPSQLSAVSKKCPPLAIAIASDQGKDYKTSNSICFPVVEISSKMGWNSGVVKRELKALEWTTSSGSARPSGVKVEFSNLCFHLMVRGDLNDDDRDRVLDELHARATLQETDQLRQLQYTHQVLRAASQNSILLCSELVDEKRCQALKQAIHRYFAPDSSELQKVVLECEAELSSSVEAAVRQDVRSLLCTHADHTWTARAVARVFHGIQSPNFPASVWGRVRRIWRAHINVPFKHILTLAQQEIIKWRKL